MTAPQNVAFKVFQDGRSELDRLLVDTAREWLQQWAELNYPSTRQLCREIERATGLDEARARRLIDLVMQPQKTPPSHTPPKTPSNRPPLD